MNVGINGEMSGDINEDDHYDKETGEGLENVLNYWIICHNCLQLI